MENAFFGKRNWIGLSIGVLVLALGFVLLKQGPANNPLSLSVAPIVLVVGFFIIIPIALLIAPDKKSVEKGKH